MNHICSMKRLCMFLNQIFMNCDIAMTLIFSFWMCSYLCVFDCYIQAYVHGTTALAISRRSRSSRWLRKNRSAPHFRDLLQAPPYDPLRFWFATTKIHDWWDQTLCSNLIWEGLNNTGRELTMQTAGSVFHMLCVLKKVSLSAQIRSIWIPEGRRYLIFYLNNNLFFPKSLVM